jgi:hypothetical protein
MTASLFGFTNSYWLCASFAAVGAFVTIVAAAVQARYILAQIRRLKELSTSTESGGKSIGDSVGGVDSSQLRRMLRTVIWISVALSASAISYTVICVLGEFLVVRLLSHSVEECTIAHIADRLPPNSSTSRTTAPFICISINSSSPR